MLSPNKAAKIREFLVNPETFGLVLLAIVLDIYGTECLEWEHDVLIQDIQEKYAIDMPEVNEDKLGAIISVLVSDVPFGSWQAFVSVIEALNDETVDPDLMDESDPYEIAWGSLEMQMLFSGDDKPIFSDEVATIAGEVLSSYGIQKLPTVLKWVQLPKQRDVSMDDTELFAGYQKVQASNVDAINQYVQERFKKLIHQLDTAPLDNRDTESWGEFMKHTQESNS